MATGSEPVSAQNLRDALAAFKEQLEAEREEISQTYLSVTNNVKTGGSGINWSNNESGPKRITFTKAGSYDCSMTLEPNYGMDVTVKVSNGGTILDERLSSGKTVSFRVTASSGTYITIEYNNSWGINVSCEINRIA